MYEFYYSITTIYLSIPKNSTSGGPHLHHHRNIAFHHLKVFQEVVEMECYKRSREKTDQAPIIQSCIEAIQVAVFGQFYNVPDTLVSSKNSAFQC